jgi:hypothetical protein
MAWWVPVIQAVGAVAGAAMANQGEREAAGQQTQSNREALELQRQIYNDQRNLVRPGYMQGGAASNKLASIFRLPQQDYGSAFRTSGIPGGYGTGGAGGTTGSGQTGNALTSALSGMALPSLTEKLTGRDPSVWNAFSRGDYVGMLDPMHIFTNDNKSNITPRNIAYDKTKDWQTFWNNSPDLQAEWQKNAKLRAEFNNDPYQFAAYYKSGPGADRALGDLTGSQPGGPEVGDGSPGFNTPGTSPISAEGTGNALVDFDMSEFWNSPYGKLSVEGFRGVDVPQVNAAYAAGGKVLSGAQKKALDDRGRARSEGAFGNYMNGLFNIAGYGQTATQQANSNAGQYGANAGNLITQQGQNQANSTRTMNNNWLTAGRNALAGWV